MTSSKRKRRAPVAIEATQRKTLERPRRWPRFEATSGWVAAAFFLIALVYHLLIGE
ncbi:MAG TPA: hypothetical protein VLG14_14725 [Sphingomonas sp.]|nr:hypothetical protein [Sphingomonas sp.]